MSCVRHVRNIRVKFPLTRQILILRDAKPRYSITLHLAEHVKQYSIYPRRSEGWIVSLEEDRTLIRRTCYRDWHRVERAAAIFRMEVAGLIARGWELRRAAP